MSREEVLVRVYAPDTPAKVSQALKRGRKNFTVKNIENTDFVGVYAIWWRNRCLYIGESRTSSVYRRLSQHLAKSHNNKLRLWVKVKNGCLLFSTVQIDKALGTIAIRQIEQVLIGTMKPETNIQGTT